MNVPPAALPRLLVLTDRTQVAGDATAGGLVTAVAAAVSSGARMVLLREKDLARAERARLAERLRPIVHGAGGLLLVASDATMEADGVHLAARDAFPAAPRPRLVGRSCHSTDDVIAARDEGCDYVTLSPVFPTASKPGHGPPIGTDVLARACAAAALPVFALGGIDETNAVRCVEAGAHGVAVMGAAMRAGAAAAVRAIVLATGAGAPEQAVAP